MLLLKDYASLILLISLLQARRHGVDKSSLSRRFRKKTTSRADKVEPDRLFNNQEEQQLISWIRRQNELCLPPSPRIVGDLAAQLAGRQPQKLVLMVCQET
ncbi:hypothetical protein M433DRAFT_544591 [Acidomyces richmondensis BFW]|nr:MAG: hypothetical protein FE78DRAFT_531725 [Acidomyces sp. 'richmondensis']KYG50425.1 hypothetical protein M433DRAFT_544591 [Acidomyces richmondensis BFW]